MPSLTSEHFIFVIAVIAVTMAVLHGTRIWMTDGGEFLEDEEAAEFHLLKLVTAAEGRSD